MIGKVMSVAKTLGPKTNTLIFGMKKFNNSTLNDFITMMIYFIETF